MTYRFTNKARKQFLKLDKSVQNRISKYMDEVASLANPRSRGRGLSGNLSGTWRYRVGDYRVFCKIMDDKFIIEVVKVGHRSDVYEG